MKKILLLLSITAAAFSPSFSQKNGNYGRYNGQCVSCKGQPSPQDGSGQLGQIYDTTGCGLNYVQASQMITTRYSPPGSGLPVTLPISGLPTCFNIIKAYVWYIASYQSSSAPTTVVNMTNPLSSVSNTNAVLSGTGGNKCWGETGSAVYRADVTASISGNGNYVLNFTGFSNPTWEIDGVTLFIIYKDPGAIYQGTMVLNDGNITGIGSASSQTMNLTAACGNSTTCSAFIIQSDMQSNINGGFHPSTVNGQLNTAYPNTFWCFDETTTSTVTQNQTTAQYGTDGLGSDCYTWGVMGLYFQTSNCMTCTPSSQNPIVLNTTGVNATCGQSNGSATANASGGLPPYTYSWSPGGQTTQTATGLSGGTYVVVVSDSLGCVAAIDTIVIGGTAPNAGFITQNVIGCAPLCVSFTNQSNPSCTGVTWNFGDNTTSNVTSPTHCYTTAGTYSVQMICTDASGCADTVLQSNIINVFPVPQALFSSNSGVTIVSPPSTPTVVCFTNSSVNGIVYSWDFGVNGNSDTSYSTNPCFTYQDTGTYCVTLTTVTSNGCIDSTQLCVLILPDFHLTVPNVFTPNGDGNNDQWYINSVGLKDLEVHIYNRWGELVYEYTGVNNGWPGKNKSGDRCSDGTYYFVAKANSITNEIREEKGFIQLLSGDGK